MFTRGKERNVRRMNASIVIFLPKKEFTDDRSTVTSFYISRLRHLYSFTHGDKETGRHGYHEGTLSVLKVRPYSLGRPCTRSILFNIEDRNPDPTEVG